jgi:hypothetical protein
MDARGCWCRDAPGLPDHTPTDKRLGCLSSDPSVPGSTRRGARLVDGVTRGRAWPRRPITVVSAAFGERCVDRPSPRKEADMASIPSSSRVVIGGIDTHKDLHVVAVLDPAGVLVGTEAFSTTGAGYRALVRWLGGFGDVPLVGIEAPAAPAPGSPATLARPGSRSPRSTGPTAPTAGGVATTTPWMPRTPPALPWPAGAPAPQEQRRHRRSPAGAAADQADGGQQPPGWAATAGQPPCRGAPGAARPGPQPDPQAAHPHRCHLTTRHQRLPRPRGRHPDRPQVPGPPDPGAGRRDRRARPAHHHPGR